MLDITRTMADAGVRNVSRSMDRIHYANRQLCGHDMLSKLQLDPTNKSAMSDAYHRACLDAMVGQGSMPIIIRAYLQVGDAIPSDPQSVSDHLASAWGMSCFYDVFMLTNDRYECKSDKEMQALLFDRFLPEIKQAFDAARTERAAKESSDATVDRLVEVIEMCASRRDRRG